MKPWATFWFIAHKNRGQCLLHTRTEQFLATRCLCCLIGLSLSYRITAAATAKFLYLNVFWRSSLLTRTFILSDKYTHIFMFQGGRSHGILLCLDAYTNIKLPNVSKTIKPQCSWACFKTPCIMLAYILHINISIIYSKFNKCVYYLYIYIYYM